MEVNANIFALLAGVLLLASLLFKYREKHRPALYLLFGAALALAVHSIFRDAYLHPWDERFHALVALNAMSEPFHPKLFPLDVIHWWPYEEWYAAYTWLHKQPLFTWQMALFMKVFGTSLAGMRSASVAMYLLLGMAVYQSVKMYFPKVAYWSALLVFCQPFLLFLVNGRQGIDHNDMAFIAWVALSFWGFVGYIKSGAWKYLVLLGAACGAAMLTKWLAGSLSLFILGLHLLLQRDFSRRSWLGLLLAGSVALILFLPWQFYAYQQWPTLYQKELDYNALHIFEAVEDHRGDWNFHLQQWYKFFPLISLLFLLAVVRLITGRFRAMPALTTSLLAIIAVMIFYGLAQTKMEAFTFLLLAPVSFMAAYALQGLFNWQGRRYLLPLIIVVVASSRLGNRYFSTSENREFVKESESLKKFALTLAPQLPENAVLFNTPRMQFVDFMFFTQQPAYENLPTADHLQQVEDKGMKAYILLYPDTKVDSNIAARATLIPADF